MKKIFLLAAFAAAALSANAQFWIGGNMLLSTEKASLGDLDNSTTSFGIVPEVGYDFNDKWSVAMSVGYEHDGDRTLDVLGQKLNGASNKFIIEPYARYTFARRGNFTAFVEGGLSYSNMHINGTSDRAGNLNSVGIGFRPGISYAIGPKVGLVARMGQLGYAHSWMDMKKVDDTFMHDKFVFGLTNAISFGAYIYL